MATWLLRYAVYRARGADRIVHTSVIDGMRITLDWAAAEHVPLREVIGRGEYWAVPGFRPGRGQTVVDAGANAGVFSLAAAQLVGPTGRVIAIEPNDAVLPRLRANVTQNGLDGRVTIVPAALGAVTGRGRMDVGRNTTIGFVRTESGPEGGVAIVTLDALADAQKLTRIDLLKVDVEGAEVEALRGGARILAATARAVVEVSDPADVPAVETTLRAADFTDIRIVEAGPDSGATLVFASRSEAA